MDVLENVFSAAVRWALIEASARTGWPEPRDRTAVLDACGAYPIDPHDADQQRFWRALRASWEAYLSAASVCGLFDGDEGADLLARLRSADSDQFRGAIAECMCCWYLAGSMRLPLEPRPEGRGNRRLEFRSPRDGGDLLFEVKAPYVPPATGAWVGDDAPVLQAALDAANRQFDKGMKNVLVIVPEVRIPIYSSRRQLVRAFIAEDVIRMDLHREQGMFVNPRRDLDVRGRFTRLWRDRGFLSPRFRRVSLVLSLERRVIDRAMYDDSVFRQRFDLPNTIVIEHVVLAVHNPYTVAPIDREVFSHVPQLIVEQGILQWTDGAKLM